MPQSPIQTSSGAVVALIELGLYLKAENYSFVAVTPETHRRLLARDHRPAKSLRDIFGWNRWFRKDLLPAEIVGLLRAADALEESERGCRSTIRFASLESHLFAHSGFPTIETDSVFFGPDTYRFLRSVQGAGCSTGRLVDVGCGSGVGGILAAKPGQDVVLADVNDRALTFARANAALAKRDDVRIVKSDVLSAVDGPLGCVICNPPYLLDATNRTYRDGGGKFGERLACRVVAESLEKLGPGGVLLLYTGAAFVDGEDCFWTAVSPLLPRSGAEIKYQELDPDVFGEELDQPGYTNVERIAAVLLTVRV